MASQKANCVTTIFMITICKIIMSQNTDNVYPDYVSLQQYICLFKKKPWYIGVNNFFYLGGSFGS